MKSKILKLSVVLLLVLTLTATNFIALGSSIISYAVDNNVELTKTNHENIRFTTYFKSETGAKTNINKVDINSNNTKIYLKVEVAKEGYLNEGKITLGKSNFLFISSNSEYVSQVTNDTITLNHMNAGTSAEIEILVKPKVDESFDLSLLNMKSEINLTGIYKDSTQKDINISGMRNIELSLITAVKEENVKNDIEVITNKVDIYNGEKKRIVQVALKNGLNDNNFPVKSINTQVNVPEINGKQPIVDKKVATNTMTKWNYTYENKNIKLDLSNEANSENKVLWKKSGNEEIILTYIYNENDLIDNLKITATEKITLYDGTEITKNAETVVNKNTEKDSIVTVKEQIVDQNIYKGKIYARLDKQFTSKTSINVNLDKVVDNVYVTENTSKYVGEGIQNIVATKYVSSTLDRKQITNVLGESGVIEISSQDTIIATIDRTTKGDENGNINITYPEGITEIKIKTSKPQKVGTIDLTHAKNIKSTDKNIIKNAKSIVTKIEGFHEEKIPTENVKGNIEPVTSNIELKETLTEAKIELNRDSLSTVTPNKNVEIKAVLKSNSEKYDLYKNPTLEIELPADVEDVTVNNINKIYGDEFTEIKAVKGIVNGKQVIKITLIGEQTEYKEPGIEGTTIIINADLTLNSKATSKEDNIKMNYTNQNVNMYKEGTEVGIETQKINIVSPKGLISTNNIEKLGIQTIGEEDTKIVTLEKSAPAKQVKVTSEIINNNEKEITNVQILGILGTDGKYIVNGQERQNNINTVLKSGLLVEGADSSKIKVYYSENENANQDLSNTENAWTETINDGAKVKKYLIVVTDMVSAESIKIGYEMEIPAGLEYNKQLIQGYETTYSETATKTEGQVKSTFIELTTGTGPIIEANLKAQLGTNTLEQNAEVKQGETIKYSTEVKNTGSEDATDIKVVGKVPEGTTVINNSNEQTIKELKSGETKKVEYEVKVNKDAKENMTIESNSKINYEEVTKTTNSITNKVSSGKLSVSILHDQVGGEEEEIVSNQITSYMATIENLTNEEQKDIKFSWNFPEEFTIYEQYIIVITGSDEDKFKDISVNMASSMTPIEKTKQITIDSIPANSKVKIYTTVNVAEITGSSKDINVSAKVEHEDKEYSSNNEPGEIKNYINYDIKLSANNENEFVKPGDTVNYKMELKNNNSVEGKKLLLENSIPEELSIKEVLVNGKVIEVEDTNKLRISLDFTVGETKTIEVHTLVNYKENSNETVKITDKATLYIGNKVTKTSNEVVHNIVQEILRPDGIKVYKINGIAWNDENSDGERQDTESIYEGMKVQLLNVATNKLATDPDGTAITGTTDNNGNYTLSNVPDGDYIVIFEYDTTKYTLTTYKKEGVDDTKNSKAVSKKMNVTEQEKTYGVTDTVKISGGNISNINIGVIKSSKFDLQLEKFINKIIVQNSDGIKTYKFNDEKLAKLEIDANKLNGTNVIIEYKIKVTNKGELDGYIKNIVDYIPNGVEFSSEINKDWYQNGKDLYNNSLGNQKLAAGDSKEVTLTVTKKMTENNIGLINNTAEISEDYNEAGVTDVNSIPANKKQGENDIGSADIIISIRTGGAVMYITLTITLITILGVGIYFIRKKFRKGNI